MACPKLNNKRYGPSFCKESMRTEMVKLTLKSLRPPWKVWSKNGRFRSTGRRMKLCWLAIRRASSICATNRMLTIQSTDKALLISTFSGKKELATNCWCRMERVKAKGCNSMNYKRAEMQARRSPSNNLSIQASTSHLLPVKKDINNMVPWSSRMINKRAWSEKKHKRCTQRRTVVVPLMNPALSWKTFSSGMKFKLRKACKHWTRVITGMSNFLAWRWNQHRIRPRHLKRVLPLPR